VDVFFQNSHKNPSLSIGDRKSSGCGFHQSRPRTLGLADAPRGCSAFAMKILALHGNGYVKLDHSIARAAHAHAWIPAPSRPPCRSSIRGGCRLSSEETPFCR
jgi:hypothetical protein